ncbi:unnamed protein product, partial [Hymenolepis diminuta]
IAYVKGFAQFSNSAGWIFINCNFQLLRVEFFEHPALGSSFRLNLSFLKPPTESHLLQVFSFTSFPQVSLNFIKGIQQAQQQKQQTVKYA